MAGEAVGFFANVAASGDVSLLSLVATLPREKGEKAEFGSSKAASKLGLFSLKIWRPE